VILRAVLRKVSPMVIRVLAFSDYLTLADSTKCSAPFSAGMESGSAFTSTARNSPVFSAGRRCSRPRCGSFQLRPRETFLYTCGGIDLWEWEVRRLDSEAGSHGDEASVCLAGRGAPPPEHCGGPTGYQLMLKRQKEGESMGTPAQVEAVIAMLTAAHPDQPSSSWDLLREVMDDGMRSIDQRLEQYGPLEPHRFRLKEANQRLAKLAERGRYRA
jgi:Plasmid pRiA4b ORF-3-like protein